MPTVIGTYINKTNLEEIKHNWCLPPALTFAVPANVDKDGLFSGFPWAYIIGGHAERLFDNIIAPSERMEDGVDDVMNFHPDAIHTYPMFG